MPALILRYRVDSGKVVGASWAKQEGGGLAMPQAEWIVPRDKEGIKLEWEARQDVLNTIFSR